MNYYTSLSIMSSSIYKPRWLSHITQMSAGCRSYNAARGFEKKTAKTIDKIYKPSLTALEHFDSLYSKVYNKQWPSMRLGLLSPKKPCAILNSYVDNDHLHKEMMNEYECIDLQRYYKKHLQSYIRLQLRKQLIENKKARKREMLAKTNNVSPETIDMDSIDVSDISDSEFRGAQTTDASEGGFSTAEDLQAMFSDRRMDDDERYFINEASTNLSLNDYVEPTEYLYKEEIHSDLAYYEGFKQDIKLDIQHLPEPTFVRDEQLKIYTFRRNDFTQFEEPQADPISRLSTYYLMDGASVLTALTLDIRMDDVCADYCAAPGGKSLAMLMTMKPKELICNDKSSSRLDRLRRIIQQHVPEVKYVKSTLKLWNRDATQMVYPDTFDRILVDVPCTVDRHSVADLDNNIFRRSRIEERVQLPQRQSQMLIAALKSLKPGGYAVYSTCTMSPLENDGVIQMALLKLLEQGYPAKFAIMDLKEAYRPFRGLFKFVTNFMYGQQIVPNICSNFGPMYICKIKRIS